MKINHSNSKSTHFLSIVYFVDYSIFHFNVKFYVGVVGLDRSSSPSLQDPTSWDTFLALLNLMVLLDLHWFTIVCCRRHK
jgi:hypothetical protein